MANSLGSAAVRAMQWPNLGASVMHIPAFTFSISQSSLLISQLILSAAFSSRIASLIEARAEWWFCVSRSLVPSENSIEFNLDRASLRIWSDSALDRAPVLSKFVIRVEEEPKWRMPAAMCFMARARWSS